MFLIIKVFHFSIVDLIWFCLTFGANNYIFCGGSLLIRWWVVIGRLEIFCYVELLKDILRNENLIPLSTLYFGDWSRQYKNRGEKDKKMVEDTKWKVLVRRVASAKAMSSLSQSKKKKSEVLFKEEAEDFIRIRNKLRWIFKVCVFIRLYSECLLEAITRVGGFIFFYFFLVLKLGG